MPQACKEITNLPKQKSKTSCQFCHQKHQKKLLIAFLKWTQKLTKIAKI